MSWEFEYSQSVNFYYSLYHIRFDFCSFAGQDGFLEHCQKLLEKFRYPWELMPLMYVILKDAGTDIDEATRRIEEGKPKQNNEIAPTNHALCSPCNLHAISTCLYISIYTYLIRSR